MADRKAELDRKKKRLEEIRAQRNKNKVIITYIDFKFCFDLNGCKLLQHTNKSQIFLTLIK